MTQQLIPNTRRHDIRVRSDGLIELSSRITRLLDLQPGDILGLLYHDGDIYIHRMYTNKEVIGHHKATLYPSKHGSRNLRISCVAAARIILKTAQRQHIARLPCGQITKINSIPVIPIITKYSPQ